jgi:flagellar export protein FliJ
MTRFRFRLAPVLQLRQGRDDEAQRALAQAERRLRDAERRHAEARERLAEAFRIATNGEREGVDRAVAAWHRNWISAKTREVEAARLVVQECQEGMQVTTRVAREARRDVRVLERFRDRTRAVFDAEQDRLERTVIDELATLQAARRLGGPR